jgi:hypothetical protein
MSLLSTRQLVVASHLAQIVISMPDGKPTSRYAAGDPLRLETCDSSGTNETRTIGTFRFPYFLPLSWQDGQPSEVAIWLGTPLHVVSTHPQRQISQAPPSEEPSKFQPLKTGLLSAEMHNWCAVGTTIGVVKHASYADTLVLTPSSASACGLLRLGRANSSPILRGAFRWRLDEGEKVARISIDEEASCLVVLKFNLVAEDALSWSISLYNLH